MLLSDQPTYSPVDIWKTHSLSSSLNKFAVECSGESWRVETQALFVKKVGFASFGRPIGIANDQGNNGLRLSVGEQSEEKAVKENFPESNRSRRLDVKRSLTSMVVDSSSERQTPGLQQVWCAWLDPLLTG
jgi:hypothetical protein